MARAGVVELSKLAAYVSPALVLVGRGGLLHQSRSGAYTTSEAEGFVRYGQLANGDLLSGRYQRSGTTR